MLRRLASLALIFAAPLALAAKPAPRTSEPKKVVTVEGITEYQLDNGLRLLLFPDNSKPTVTVNVTYLVGSRQEGYGETGMAHLLEHLMFKGTATRDNILGLLEQHGAFSNGSTDYDRTNYFEVLPAIPGNLQFALEMEADRMVHSRIAKVDLDKEFTVVRNEFETDENSPDAILEERMLSTAFLWHNYGKSPIGSRSDIERVNIPSLQAFYARFYQPDNAQLVIAGKFDEKEALALVSKTFGAIPRPTRELSKTYTVEPVQDGERSVTLRRTGDLSRVGLLYHGVAGSDEDFVAERALVHLLVNKPSGRLYTALVDKGLSPEVNGDAYPWAEPGVFDLFAAVREGQPLDKVQSTMLSVVEGLGTATGPNAANPIRDEEVKRFQASALKDIELAMTRSERIGIELSEWAAQGDWRLMFIYRDRVKSLTTDRVQKFAAKFLKSANRTLGEFIPSKSPDRSPAPSLPEVATLVKGYVGNAAIAEGEQFVASIDNIEKRTERSTLGNGMKLALLSKTTRGNAVEARFVFRYGSEKELKGHLAATEILGPLLMRGTTKHTYQQITDTLDKLHANVRADGEEFGGVGSGAGRGLGFHVTTTRENLPAVIDLLTEIVRQPAFPKEELETVRKEQVARLEEMKQNPQLIAFTSLFRKVMPYAKDDVRYVPTVEEHIAALNAVTLAEVTDLYKNLLGGSAAQGAIVGDFDAAATRAQLAKNLGDWKSARPFARIEKTYKSGVAASEERLLMPDKEGALVAVAAGIDARDDDPDYAAAQLINHVLGGGFKSRLMGRLRQKEGLSYGAFSFIQAAPLDRWGIFGAGAICAPQNATKAMTALLEELDKITKEGIPAAELEEGKKAFLLQFENKLSSDAFVLSTLAEGLYLNRTFEYNRQLNDKVAKLKSSDLTPVLVKYVPPSRLVKVLAGDLDKKVEPEK